MNYTDHESCSQKPIDDHETKVPQSAKPRLVNRFRLEQNRTQNQQ